LLGRGSDAISPTAHYTGHVWVRNGLSHPELATTEGRLFYDAVAPTMLARRLAGGTTLEDALLSRHRTIDALLGAAIDDGRIGQVIEVACGMSPRGWRFSGRYGERVTYVEADLPAMAARKRAALERIGSLSAFHRVAEVDALSHSGPASLAAIAKDLDPDRGLAIITEGLLTYLEHDDVLALWRRFAAVTQDFSHGIYLSDLRLGDDAGISERVFYLFLSAFVRGRVHIHFDDEQSATRALKAAGFGDAELHRGETVHVLEASTSG
jgi:O-methyltransferase involved in polyketide biosynthesis